MTTQDLELCLEPLPAPVRRVDTPGLTNAEGWLRWQLTRRHGLLWHEVCGACVAYKHEPGRDEPGSGYCFINGWHVYQSDACTSHEEVNRDD